MDLLHRYDVWLDFVHGLLTQTDAEFPRAAVAELLDATVETAIVCWTWADSDGSFGSELNRLPPGPGWPEQLDAAWAQRVRLRHPLNMWFTISQDPRPMTVARTPRAALPRWAVPSFREEHMPFGVGYQLAVPYRLGLTTYRAFVLGRGEEDYSDDDLELCRRIQPLLALLERQVSVLEGVERAEPHPELTARETAVLHLLARGGTAAAIAHRLGISPRTVHSHLQHLYRKLGVSDRLRAVLSARAQGLVATPDPRPSAEPGRAPGEASRDAGVVMRGSTPAGASLSDLRFSFSAADAPPASLYRHA